MDAVSNQMQPGPEGQTGQGEETASGQGDSYAEVSQEGYEAYPANAPTLSSSPAVAKTGALTQSSSPTKNRLKSRRKTKCPYTQPNMSNLVGPLSETWTRFHILNLEDTENTGRAPINLQI